MAYFVISSSEDGVTIEQVEAQELLERLNVDWWGSDPVLSPRLPRESDPARWPPSLVIIKGEVQVPHPKQTVVEWEL